METNAMINAFKNPFIRYTPLIIIFIYLNLTVFIFFFGPVKYNIENPIKISIFLFASHLMLLLGYMYGTSRKEKEIKIPLNGIKLFKISLIIFLIFIPLTNYLNTGSFIFKFSNFNNLGQAYNESLQLRSGSSTPILAYLRALFSPFLIVFLPLGIFYWKRLNKFTKCLFLLGVLGGLGLDFFRGTNKSLADYLIIFLLMLIIINIFKVYSNSNIHIKNSSSGKILIRFIFLLVFGVIFMNLFFEFFSATVPERNGLSLKSIHGHYYTDPNHLWIANLPLEGKLVVATFFNYFIQGYHGLDLALSKEFLPTFGFGNSMFLILNVSDILQNNILYNNSYIFRNDSLNNWDWFVNWSTFYVWVASDITFIGTVFLMFIIGYLLAKTWKRVLLFKEFPSLIIFIQLSILCFYIPANNQLLQNLDGVIGNSFWFIFWFYIMYFRRIRW